MMSDMTSGYNIAKQISLEPAFDDCCGFREAEIEETLQKIVEVCDLQEESTNEALTMMRTFYDGYAAKKVAEIFYRTGNMEPLADFIEQRYFKIFDNRDYKSANELTLSAKPPLENDLSDRAF